MHRSQSAPHSAPNRCYHNQQAHQSRMLRTCNAPKPVCPAKCAKQMLSLSTGSSLKNVAYMYCTEASVACKVQNRCDHYQQAHHWRMLRICNAPKPVCPAKCAKQMLSLSTGSSFKNVTYVMHLHKAHLFRQKKMTAAKVTTLAQYNPYT